jgi:hypothetical protein
MTRLNQKMPGGSRTSEPQERKGTCPASRTVLIAAVLVVLVIPGRLASAQVQPAYVLIDLGAFGGDSGSANGINALDLVAK